jgi:hypothetical protein
MNAGDGSIFDMELHVSTNEGYLVGVLLSGLRKYKYL